MKRRNFILLAFTTLAGFFGAARVGLSASLHERAPAHRITGITKIIVEKSKRRLHLISGEKVVRSYAIRLGFAPKGHKQFEGDGKTPEGIYFIDRKNPESDFHLSLGISYPNAADIAYARAQGRAPGGDIFIHGRGDLRRWRNRKKKTKDWTAGCIAVRNGQMEQIYQMVELGTPIDLRP